MQLKWRWPSLPVSVMLRTTTRTHEANHEHFQTLFAVVDPSGFVLHSQVQYRNALFSFTLYPLSLWRIRSPQLQVTHFFFLLSFFFLFCSAPSLLKCSSVCWCTDSVSHCSSVVAVYSNSLWKKPQIILINVALMPLLVCSIKLLLSTFKNKCHRLWDILECK